MATHGRRRALGQHFLKDTGLCEKIAAITLEEADKNACRSLLEIGPGKGALTLPLFSKLKEGSRFSRFTVVEKDRKIAEEWSSNFSFPWLKIFSADFLELPRSEWLTEAPLAVVSNLPYSAGTAILTELASHPDEIAVMVLMFQAEVAQRLRAEPDTKAWGSLSVWVQNRWDVTKLFLVKPGAFSPPPDVDSEVVILRRRQQPRIVLPPSFEPQWERLLKACFAHRRKMLRAGLKGHSDLQNALEVSGVDGTKRAEALNWDEWAKIWDAVLKTRSTGKR